MMKYLYLLVLLLFLSSNINNGHQLNYDNTTIGVQVKQIKNGVQVKVLQPYNETIHQPLLFNHLDCKYQNDTINNGSTSYFICQSIGILYLEGLYPVTIGSQTINVYLKYEFPLITNVQTNILDLFGPKIELYGYFGDIENQTINNISMIPNLKDKVQISINDRECIIKTQSSNYISCFDAYYYRGYGGGEQTLSIKVNGFTTRWTRSLYYQTKKLNISTPDCNHHGEVKNDPDSGESICKCNIFYGGYQCGHERLFLYGSFVNQDFNSLLFHILNMTILEIQEVDGSTSSNSWYGGENHDDLVYKTFIPGPSNMEIIYMSGISPSIPLTKETWHPNQNYTVSFKYHPNATKELPDYSSNMDNNLHVDIYINMTVIDYQVTTTLSISRWNFSTVGHQLRILSKYQLNYMQPFEQPLSGHGSSSSSSSSVESTISSSLESYIENITHQERKDVVGKWTDGHNGGLSILNTFTVRDALNTEYSEPMIQLIANRDILFNIVYNDAISDQRSTFSMRRIESIDKSGSSLIVSQYIPQFRDTAILTSTITTYHPKKEDQPMCHYLDSPESESMFKLIITLISTLIIFAFTIPIIFYLILKNSDQ